MENFSFASLLIISVLAFIVPIFASWIPRGLIPIAVAEIIAGMIVGRSGLDLIKAHEWLNFLSLFGAAFLMFLSGLEVNLGMLAPRSGAAGSNKRNFIENPLTAGILIFAGTFVSASLAAWLVLESRSLAHVIMTGLVLCTTSVGMVVPTLKERGLTGQRLGQTILMAAVVADFSTMFLITILAGLLARNDLWQLSLVLLLFVVFLVVSVAGAWLWRNGSVRRTFTTLSHATAQIQVRGSLALLVVFVVLAEALRAELVLAAFLAGAAISSVSREEGSVLRTKLDSIGYGFFIPIFLITVGAQFNLAALLSSRSSVLLVPLFVGIAFLVKVVPSLILRTGYSWRQTLGAGVLISARLGLIIAASAIGLRLGVIDDATNSALVLVAIVTCIVSPALFNLLLPGSSNTTAAYAR